MFATFTESRPMFIFQFLLRGSIISLRVEIFFTISRFLNGSQSYIPSDIKSPTNTNVARVFDYNFSVSSSIFYPFITFGWCDVCLQRIYKIYNFILDMSMHKKCHFLEHRPNFRISWSISILFIPLKTGIGLNTLQ